MPQSPFLAFDLDGTLTNEEKVITPRTYAALMEAQRQGARIILASGRPPYGMQPLCDQLEMARYGGIMLAYNGGHVEDVATGNVIYEQQMPDTFLPRFKAWQEESGMTLMSYYKDHIYTEHPDDRYVHQSAKNNNMQIVAVEDFVRDMPRPINKCLMVGDPAVAARWEKRMIDESKGEINVCRSTPYFIELLPLGIDKGLALAKLMPLLGTTTDHLIAFGDSYNDIGMLQTAHIGVAMGNAEDAVKAVADYITDTNENDGIAQALQILNLI